MNRRSHFSLLVAVGVVVSLSWFGCMGTDDDGSGPTDVADMGQRDIADTGAVDTTGFPDVVDDVVEDTGPPDLSDPQTSEPEVPAPTCGQDGQECCDGVSCDGGLDCSGGLCVSPGNCPSVPACIPPVTGTPDIDITYVSGSPPTLAGGILTRGEFELADIYVYTDNTFTELVTSVTVDSNGNTYGSLRIQGKDWGFNANLDLSLVVGTGFGDFPQEIVQGIEAGGCFTVSSNQIYGDLTECGGYWPEGATPPESLQYENTGTGLELLMILPREALMASIPEEYQFIAGLAIAENGNLPILFSFELRN